MLACGLLLLGAVGLCVHYGTVYDDRWPHPTAEELDEDFESYGGSEVLVFGEVQSVDGDNAVIHVLDRDDDVVAELTVHGFRGDVSPGGFVQVYGTLHADRTMDASRTVVVTPDSTSRYYKLGISLVGAMLAIGYFFRHWRIDVGRLAIVPREEGDR